eukprot:SM000189S04072  [mRNA]  locus=s189:19956:21981:+ [translate_table: standard]
MELRQRPAAAAAAAAAAASPAGAGGRRRSAEGLPGFWASIAAYLCIAAAFIGLYLTLTRSGFLHGHGHVEKVFTAEELAQYDGSDPSRPILLAILGNVYDVSKGRGHYGKDGSYSHFAGRDASRAFVSGKFNGEGLTDDITGLTAADLAGLKGWRSFFEGSYTPVGKVEGRFYDDRGNPKDILMEVEVGSAHAAEEAKKEKEAERRHPSCNSRWCGAMMGCTRARSSGWVARESACAARAFPSTSSADQISRSTPTAHHMPHCVRQSSSRQLSNKQTSP